MKVVFDSCVFIDFLRCSKHQELFYERTFFRYLSPIVAMELRAGANNQSKLRAVDELVASYNKSQRMIGISGNMYLIAGKILQDVQRDYGNISRGLSHDILIALSSASIGAHLFTSNRNDFDRISKYHSFAYTIV
jgi:predicted nucleic acid-binding protein